MTEGLVSAGVAEQTDVDQIKVQVLTMTNVIKSIERNVELAQNLLCFQLGVDGDTEIVLTQTVIWKVRAGLTVSVTLLWRTLFAVRFIRHRS